MNHETINLNITYRQVDELKPYTKTARTHTKDQLRQIAESIRVFGFTKPILIDKKNTIIAGHGRVEAAKTLGMSQVPTSAREPQRRPDQGLHHRRQQARRNAGWDTSILAIELQHLLTPIRKGLPIPEIRLSMHFRVIPSFWLEADQLRLFYLAELANGRHYSDAALGGVRSTFQMDTSCKRFVGNH